MKAAKVMIAAAVVALMFIAVPFASAASDAAWAEDDEKAAYFKIDPEMATFDDIKEIAGLNESDLSMSVIGYLGYDNSIFDCSDFTITVDEFYGGYASSLCEKEWTNECVASKAFSYEFTATVNTDSDLFRPYYNGCTSEILDYLGLEDGTVTVGDKLIFSGTIGMTAALKTVGAYKDVDDTYAACYSCIEDSVLSINVDAKITFIRGDVEKEFEEISDSSNIQSDSMIYDVGDEETVDDVTYYPVERSRVETVLETVNFCIDGTDNIYIMQDYASTDAGTEYALFDSSDYEEISDIDVSHVNFRDAVGSSPLAEEQLKEKLASVGEISKDIADVDGLYASITTEEESSTNQILFFGAFIVILVIVVVVAAIFREKRSE